MRNVYQFNLILTVLVLCASISVAQLREPTVEIFIEVENSSDPTGTTNFVLAAQSTVWDGPSVQSTYYTPSTRWIEELPGGTCVADNDGSNEQGFNNSISATYSNYPIFGYGLYKLYVDTDPSGYILIDYRDDRYGFYTEVGDPSGHGADIWVKYNETSGKFWISTESGPTVYSEITANSTTTIWGLKEMGNPSTGKFPPYSPQNMRGCKSF